MTSNGLTLERLIDLVFTPPLYYATSKDTPRGGVMYSEEPEFIICHPDDLDHLHTQLTGRHLVHLHDKPLPSPPIDYAAAAIEGIEEQIADILLALAKVNIREVGEVNDDTHM